MTIHYNCTGERRKELVHAITEILECDSKYLGMPTQGYAIGSYTVSKTGELIFDDRTDSDEVEQLIEALCERGFEAEVSTTEPIGLCISYPRSKLSDAGLERLKKLLEAKCGLIKKALGVAALPVTVDDEKVSFPWFETMPKPDETAAYSRFLCALCSFAEHQKRIACKVAEVENEKYAFRCFLLRLGFIGESYELKQARRILLSKLSGNTAFRQPHKADTAGIPTEDNTAALNAEEAKEQLIDPKMQEEIKAILNGEDNGNEDAE